MKETEDKFLEEERNLSREERQAFCERIRAIVKDIKKKFRSAVEEDLGTEDFKKGSKELRKELETKDIRDLFK